MKKKELKRNFFEFMGFLAGFICLIPDLCYSEIYLRQLNPDDVITLVKDENFGADHKIWTDKDPWAKYPSSGGDYANVIIGIMESLSYLKSPAAKAEYKWLSRNLAGHAEPALPNLTPQIFIHTYLRFCDILGKALTMYQNDEGPLRVRYVQDRITNEFLFFQTPGTQNPTLKLSKRDQRNLTHAQKKQLLNRLMAKAKGKTEFTGYYEPIYEGRRNKNNQFNTRFCLQSSLECALGEPTLNPTALDTVWFQKPKIAQDVRMQGSAVIVLENGKRVSLEYVNRGKFKPVPFSPATGFSNINVVPRRSVATNKFRRGNPYPIFPPGGLALGHIRVGETGNIELDFSSSAFFDQDSGGGIDYPFEVDINWGRGDPQKDPAYENALRTEFYGQFYYLFPTNVWEIDPDQEIKDTSVCDNLLAEGLMPKQRHKH